MHSRGHLLALAALASGVVACASSSDAAPSDPLAPCTEALFCRGYDASNGNALVATGTLTLAPLAAGGCGTETVTTPPHAGELALAVSFASDHHVVNQDAKVPNAITGKWNGTATDLRFQYDAVTYVCRPPSASDGLPGCVLPGSPCGVSAPCCPGSVCAATDPNGPTIFGCSPVGSTDNPGKHSG